MSEKVAAWVHFNDTRCAHPERTLPILGREGFRGLEPGIFALE
jgi:hypothetical protein